MPSLYYGDNLYVLRESIADESVDLIYPPVSDIVEPLPAFTDPACPN